MAKLNSKQMLKLQFKAFNGFLNLSVEGYACSSYGRMFHTLGAYVQNAQSPHEELLLLTDFNL